MIAGWIWRNVSARSKRIENGGLWQKAVIRLLSLEGLVLDEVVLPLGFQEITLDVTGF